MRCKNCGGSMIGDGYTEPLRCEFAEVEEGTEPDANPVYCGSDAGPNPANFADRGAWIEAHTDPSVCMRLMAEWVVDAEADEAESHMDEMRGYHRENG